VHDLTDILPTSEKGDSQKYEHFNADLASSVQRTNGVFETCYGSRG
jgi:hypothetical protein